MADAPRLLDLFCGAGGATKGYQLAGFHVTGVDHLPQPHYCGDAFHQADALTFVAAHGDEYDVIHASPPCQAYSRMRHLPWLRDKKYPDLLPQVYTWLYQSKRPWIIENVETAPLDGVVLCGQMFGLPLYRHRRFGSNILLLALAHTEHRTTIFSSRYLNKRYSQTGGVIGVHPIVTIAGHTAGMVRYAPAAMGIDWMSRDELTQAIPPAYTEWIGQQLRRVIG